MQTPLRTDEQHHSFARIGVTRGCADPDGDRHGRTPTTWTATANGWNGWGLGPSRRPVI
jgi:hypothetical protein